LRAVGLPGCSTLAAVTKLGKAELNEMVAEAIVDAHDEDEQVSGFYNIIEDELAVPFKTTVLGVAVTVEAIGLTSSGITATCVRGKHRQAIPILDLPLPEPPPAGWEWIAAYRQWARPRRSSWSFPSHLPSSTMTPAATSLFSLVTKHDHGVAVTRIKTPRRTHQDHPAVR